MKDIYAVAIGVGAFAAGCAALAVVEDGRIKKMDAKLTGITGGMSFIKDNIDLNIEEDFAKELVRIAAKDVATNVVNDAAAYTKKEIASDISNQVKNIISASYKNVEESVKKELESQINLQTIEKVQNMAAEKVAKQILDKSLILGTTTTGTSKEDLIKTCVANGMDAWDIKRILEATK